MANQSQSQTNPLAEFGGVSVDTPTPPPTAQVPSSQSPTTNPLAEFGGIAIHEETPKTPNAYETATASSPYAPAGAAEKAMGQQFGNNKAQAKEALKDILKATAETGAGIAAAAPAATALSGAGAAGSEILAQLAKEHPTAARVVKAYTSWLAIHMAHKMGIPLPKVLEVIGE